MENWTSPFPHRTKKTKIRRLMNTYWKRDKKARKSRSHFWRCWPKLTKNWSMRNTLGTLFTISLKEFCRLMETCILWFRLSRLCILKFKFFIQLSFLEKSLMSFSKDITTMKKGSNIFWRKIFLRKLNSIKTFRVFTRT